MSNHVFFHINDNNIEKECSSPDNCQFGNVTHYATRQEAREAIQENFVAKYGATPPAKSRRVSPIKFIERSGIRVNRISSIVDYQFKPGPIDVSTVDILDEKPSNEVVDGIKTGRIKSFATANQ